MGSRAGLSIVLSTLVVSLVVGPASAQTPTPAPEPAAATFRSGVSVVSVSAVVRDRHGRVMSSLTSRDFEVLDNGERRELIDFQSTASAPASVALLIDGSGSMRLGAAREIARYISLEVLRTLDPTRDTAALFSFDTRLLTLCQFTSDFSMLHAGLGDVDAFGSTSLYDAVAGTSALVADQAHSRRAVIVLTDGDDTSSAYTADTVAWIASTIDVPVYVFAVGDGLAAALSEERGAPRAGSLTMVARATGGEFFIANTPQRIAAAVKRVSEELRHQYVLAFESAAAPGVRRLDVRTHRSGLRVKSRSFYQSLE